MAKQVMVLLHMNIFIFKFESTVYFNIVQYHYLISLVYQLIQQKHEAIFKFLPHKSYALHFWGELTPNVYISLNAGSEMHPVLRQT